ERLVQGDRGQLQELADLQGGRGLLAQEVDPRTILQELEDQLALAHPSPAIDRNESAARSIVGIREDSELFLASDEGVHLPSTLGSKARFVKSRLDKSCCDEAGEAVESPRDPGPLPPALR